MNTIRKTTSMEELVQTAFRSPGMHPGRKACGSVPIAIQQALDS